MTEKLKTILMPKTGDSKEFNFSIIDLALIMSGRYHVEKHRCVLEEIKVG